MNAATTQGVTPGNARVHDAASAESLDGRCVQAQPLTPDVINYICRAARCQARLRVLGDSLMPSEERDFEGDLVLAAWRRLRSFDSSRGEIRSFIAVVVRQSASSVLRARRAACRNPHDRLMQLQEVDGCGRAYSNRGDLAIDCQRLLRRLPARLRRIAHLLSRGFSPNDIAHRLRLSRSTFYRCRRELEVRLRRAGLHAYLSRSPGEWP